MENSEKTLYLLQHITSLLARSIDQILLEQIGIGNAQYKILSIVKQNPKVSQRQIVGALGQTEASISRQLKLLKSDGLITVSKDPMNKRAHITNVTQKADNIINQASEVIRKYYSPAFGEISTNKQQQLIELLKSLDEQICTIDHGNEYLGFIEENEKSRHG